MSSDTDKLQGVADVVVGRAERQGYVLAREVREELARAGLPEDHWKDVLALAKPAFRHQKGRYYLTSPGVSVLRSRLREDQRQQQEVHHAVRNLIRRYQDTAVQNERRLLGRIPFILPIKLVTEDQRELHCVSRDISVNGLRLMGVYNLVGQKVRAFVPDPDEGGRQYCFTVQILWSAKIADDLFENGGFFLDMNATPS
jgi:hypothetical protein